MRKGLVITLSVVGGLFVIGSLTPSQKSPTIQASASATPTATASAEPSPSLTPKPEMSKDTTYSPPELIVDDLGESNCSKFSVCTFVNIKAVKTCKNAEIYIDLFDDNDENYDTESVPVGTIKKGTKLRNIEVGTDDTDAAYVEQSDFLCG
jgi:hypothetical protein